MFGAVPVSTSTDAADVGAFFITNDGYLDMCGHATIGLVTAFVELGRLPRRERIAVETPAGLVETRPVIRDGTVERVAFRNVDSYYVGRREVSVEPVGRLSVDVVFAGNTFAMVDSRAVGVGVARENTDRLIDLGRSVRRAVNAAADLHDPVTGDRVEVELVEFYEHADGFDRNLTVFANGSVDRSPCGSGTCAKMALLHADGQLEVGEPYRHRSVIDTEFEGEIESVERRNGHCVVSPVISGSAYVIARNEFTLDPADPIIGFNVAEE
jgi:proline racemase